jgi:GR25 family glycosyltransferase involved in LPS biosynthesis
LRLYCINLDRSPHRLAAFHDANRHLRDVTRFSAVDGRTLDLPALAQRGLAAPDILETQTPGGVGCSLSHAALWDEAIRHGEAITVCEDDAIFNAQFDRVAAEVIATLPPDWDIIAWGWNFDLFMSFEMLPGVSSSLCQFEQQRMREGAATFQAQAVSPKGYRLLWAFGTPCYSVSPKGAAVLKERLLPFRPMTITCPEGVRAPPQSLHYRVLSIDGALNSIYRHIDAFVSFPPLVITKNEDTSVHAARH